MPTTDPGAVTGRLLRVRELLHRPGVQRTDRGAFALAEAAVTASGVPDGASVTYELRLEAQGSRVDVTGTATAPWEGPCRRCLEPTGGEVTAAVAEIFETRPTPGETWPIEDGVIDLEPPLREAIVLELPLAPLCRPDCPGPDPERYPTTTAPEEDAEPARDPRWAALDALSIDDPEGN